MLTVEDVCQKFMWVVLLCVISLTCFVGCAGHSIPDKHSMPTGNLSANGPRIAVVPFEDWNPPDEDFQLWLGLMPGILFTGNNTYMSHSGGGGLVPELFKSGGFSAVDSLSEWPAVEKLLSYDFVITGRQLGYGFNSRHYSYGLSVFGFVPAFLGLPMSGTMFFGDFEVVVLRVATPYDPILKERVTYEDPRAWGSIYYHNDHDDSESSAKWHEASDHIIKAIRASSEAAP